MCRAEQSSASMRMIRGLRSPCVFVRRYPYFLYFIHMASTTFQLPVLLVIFAPDESQLNTGYQASRPAVIVFNGCVSFPCSCSYSCSCSERAAPFRGPQNSVVVGAFYILFIFSFYSSSSVTDVDKVRMAFGNLFSPSYTPLKRGAKVRQHPGNIRPSSLGEGFRSVAMR